MALSGPTLPPARGPATHLVVLVHGYGADGQDLIGLAQHWRELLPTTAFAMVAATGDIFYGLWYPVIIAAMTFIVGMLFIRETTDVDIDARD